MKVLDHGKITLRRHLADDVGIATSARVIEDLEWRGKPDEKLLGYMLRQEHTSPFEHGYLEFYVELPMFVMNQWVRHRTWSFNIQSGRYEDEGEETKYYVPGIPRLQDEKNRQNSIVTDDLLITAVLWDELGDTMAQAQESYSTLRELGIAREMARLVMPQNKYSRMIASVDPHNFMHFLYLRMHKDAQLEIREYARAAYMLWKDIMPVTASIWTNIHADRIGLND